MKERVANRRGFRIVLLDAFARVLLLWIRDVTNPRFGTSWELPGGGVERSQTDIVATIKRCARKPASRLRQKPSAYRLGGGNPLTRTGGVRRVQDEFVCCVRVTASAPLIEMSCTEAAERQDHSDIGGGPSTSWRRAPIGFTASGCPELLPGFLRGSRSANPSRPGPETNVMRCIGGLAGSRCFGSAQRRS